MKYSPFDNDYELTEEQKIDKGKEIVSLFTTVFNSDEGKMVLAYIERALDSSSPISSTSDLYAIGVRDGRRDAFQQIKRNIKG